MECYSSLLNLGVLDPEGMHRADYDSTFACKNIAIRGKGTIASGGRVLAERIIASETENLKDYLPRLAIRSRNARSQRQFRQECARV